MDARPFIVLTVWLLVLLNVAVIGTALTESLWFLLLVPGPLVALYYVVINAISDWRN